MCVRYARRFVKRCIGIVITRTVNAIVGVGGATRREKSNAHKTKPI